MGGGGISRRQVLNAFLFCFFFWSVEDSHLILKSRTSLSGVNRSHVISLSKESFEFG